MSSWERRGSARVRDGCPVQVKQKRAQGTIISCPARRGIQMTWFVQFRLNRTTILTPLPKLVARGGVGKSTGVSFQLPTAAVAKPLRVSIALDAASIALSQSSSMGTWTSFHDDSTVIPARRGPPTWFHLSAVNTRRHILAVAHACLIVH